ncbi:MAG: hypothetical protein NTW62_02115 [Candidatus Nomurabacteria bacterium]|nr:hypothetical protein [Candidatus Nomurabacteria bacterium]
MPEQKASMYELFKNGPNFEFKKIDYSSPKITKEVEELKKQKEKIQNQAKVSIWELQQIVFTI